MCRELADVARHHASSIPISGDRGCRALRRFGRAAYGKTFREEFSIDAATPLVLYVGNLQKYQGIDLLLEAFARTKAPGALVIVGGDAAQHRPAERARRPRSDWKAMPLGGPRPVRDLASYLLQADILGFAAPSSA
jgi:glycosyltransferase involved in cell wall biosynthesis